MSSFNAKSSPVPEEWQDLVDDWLNKMGYRFVLRRFTFPPVIKQNGKLSFTSWWENKGVAPCYKDFAFAIRLKNGQGERIFTTNANIREWLPGDIVYDNAFFIPRDMKPGIYEVQVGIIDPFKQKPVVKLAIEGRNAEGWYPMGTINLIH
jgi:hypothetical protein